MGEPGVLGTAARAWHSTLSALARMPLAFLITLALVVAVDVLTSHLMPAAATGEPGHLLDQPDARET